MRTVPFPRVSGQTNNSSSGMVSLACLVYSVGLVFLAVRFRQPERPASNAQASGQILRVTKKVAAWARREIRSFWNMLAR
jgi:hypothetical protein